MAAPAVWTLAVWTFAVWIFAVWGLAAGPVLAQGARSTGLDLLERREKILGWEAVGKLDIEGGGFCTATLIETTLVLTAAHCVFEADGQAVAPSRVTFRAGQSGDHAIATGRAARIAAHPGYDPRGQMSAQNVRHDLALVELATPIPAAVAAPFPVQAPGRLRTVSVVSYAQDRSAALSWQRECSVTGQGQGLMQFDCDVHFGSSGAPVFDRSGARARIVSVISAGNREGGRSVSYGMELPDLVTAMKAQLRSGRDVISDAPRGAPPATIRRIGVGTPGKTTAGQSSGAKFLRP
ncbi:MAG: trypsin-like serine peptidase [Pseudorhodobacter sp.]